MGFGTWMKEQRELALAKKADQDAVKAAVKTRVDAASREAEIATKVAREVAKWQQRNAALDAQFEKNKAKFEAEQAAKAARELAKRRKVEIREYNNAKDFENDAKKRMRDGWELEGQTQVGSHVNVGRTAAKALAFTALAGPLGLLAAGSRTNGKITVTWIKQG